MNDSRDTMTRFLIAAILLTLPEFAQAQPPAASADTRQIPETVSHRVIGPDEISQYRKTHGYQPISRQEFFRLLDQQQAGTEAAFSSIERAEYSGRLSGTTITEGKITLQLEAESSDSGDRSVTSLGKTSLQNIQLYSRSKRLELATNSGGNLISLEQPLSSTITGTWTADGTAVGSSTVFQLKLPAATLCEFTLRTDSDTIVSSPNALVARSISSPDDAVWTLHPGNPTSVTISCTSRTENLRNDSIGLTVSADYKFHPFGGIGTWSVGVPQTLTNATLDFSVGDSCDVQAVTLSNGTPLPWNAVADGKRSFRVRVPLAQVGLNLNIEAEIKGSTGDVIDVPFLVPNSWKPMSMGDGGALSLRSSSLRLTVSPEVVVTQVDVDGVFENDVQYGSDGSQILSLSQFAQVASARLITVPSVPVIEDSVVMQELSEQGKTDAYVAVVARSGFAGTLQWNVPTSWRVTDVRELGSTTPLLFRISDPDGNESESQLTVTLRTPISADGNQHLLIRMQSTGGQLYGDLPALLNAAYCRRHDFFIPAVKSSGILRQTGTDDVSVTELGQLLPWLPVDEFVGRTAFARTNLLTLPSTLATAHDGIMATVDYSVTADRGTVHESLRLNLKSQNELPSKIPLQVTSGVELRLSDESDVQPAPVLKREAGGRRFDDWFLEFPSGTGGTHEINVLFTSSRMFTGSMPAAMIEVPQSRQEGGTVQPLAGSANIVLLDANRNQIRNTRQYPERPFENAFRLQADSQDSAPQTVSGNAFLILTNSADGIRVEAKYRLLIRSQRTASQLILDCSNVESLLAFIDGYPVHPERTRNTFRIPLSENQEHSAIEIFLTTLPASGDTTNFHLPVLIFPKTEDVQLNCFVLTPEHQIPTDAEGQNLTTIQTKPSITSLALQNPVVRSNSTHVGQQQTFATRWQIKSSRDDVLCLMMAHPESGSLELQLYDARFDTSKTLIATLTVFLLWIWLLKRSAVSWWLAGGCLLSVVVWQGQVTHSWQPCTAGLTYGTIIAGLTSILLKRLSVSAEQVPVTYKVALQSAVAMVLATLSLACGAEEETRPRVLVPEGSLPVLYVDDIWLNLLRQNSFPKHEDALVVDTKVDLTVMAMNSAAATIRCDVATRPYESSGLIIPLTGLTVVECSLDGEPVFPTRRRSGETMIVIPPQSVLPTRNLSANQESVSSAGPETIIRRAVQYTVRITPETVPGALKFLVPHPPSPQTHVELIDQQQLVSSARISGTAENVAEFRRNAFVFPAVFNSQGVELSIDLKDTDTASAEDQRRSEVLCRAEVSPSQTRLVCEYQITAADIRSAEVRIGRNRRYRVISVESLSGQRLPWAVDNDQLVIQITPDSAGTQQLKVQLVSETATNLKQIVKLKKAATVNGVRADSVTLLTTTSELFVVNAVTLNSDDAKEESVTTTTPGAEPVDGSRGVDRPVVIPADVNSVEVELSRQSTTREARLIQSAIVNDREIEWTCRCDIDIAGQPAFRQSLKLSPEVRIQSITVSNGEVSRLQSWSRNGDLIVISLREATRGSPDPEYQRDAAQTDQQRHSFCRSSVCRSKSSNRRWRFRRSRPRISTSATLPGQFRTTPSTSKPLPSPENR